jgi:hypothetical protein
MSLEEFASMSLLPTAPALRLRSQADLHGRSEHRSAARLEQRTGRHEP